MDTIDCQTDQLLVKISYYHVSQSKKPFNDRLINHALFINLFIYLTSLTAVIATRTTMRHTSQHPLMNFMDFWRNYHLLLLQVQKAVLPKEKLKMTSMGSVRLSK